VTPHSSSIAELVATGTLDAELAALLWLLTEGRVPLVVAGPARSGRTTVLTALLDLLPPTADTRFLVGAAGDFDWLTDADRLGWHAGTSGVAGPPVAPASPVAPGAVAPASPVAPGDPARTIMLAGGLDDLTRDGIWGDRARTAIRALSLGYGLMTTVRGDSLEDVLARLRAPEVGLTDDELSYLGVVIVMRSVVLQDGASDRRRVAAAHYLRPLSRTPAATCSGWVRPSSRPGTSDVTRSSTLGGGSSGAGRSRRTQAGDLEADHARRTGYLADLVAAGVTDHDALQSGVSSARNRSVPKKPTEQGG
jgi:hypothetical protein